MKRISMKVLAVLTVLSLAVLPEIALAMERPPVNKDKKTVTQKNAERERLFKLREENPRKFQETVKLKGSEARKKLEALKQTDPARYNRVIQRIRQKRLARLTRLRKENPEKFKEIVQARKARVEEQLTRLKNENPALYQRIIEHGKKYREIQRFRQDHKKFKSYLKNHPELRYYFRHRCKKA
ncbi:MAG: hypothetical protein AB1481_06335 [Candidatus Omnitrophota bacterium]